MLRKDLHPSDAALLPDGGGWLLVEFGGANEEEAAGRAHGLMEGTGRKNRTGQA